MHRDGHVACHRTYCSVVHEHVGCDVRVRAETRLVRIYNQRFVPMAGRIALASVNLIAAAVLLLIVRQKSAPPP